MKVIEEAYDWSSPLVRRTVPVTHLIIHHAAVFECTAQDIHRWHLARGWRGIGYNYFVSKAGSIFRGRPEDMIGGHTEGYNNNGIGVCFEGNFEVEEMFDRQTEAGAQLVSDIASRYPDIIIIRHSEVNATACPGENFPFDEIKEGFMSYESFKSYMEQYMAELAQKDPSEWSAEARQWAESEGFIKGDELGRKQYKKPLTREEYVQMEYRQGKNK